MAIAWAPAFVAPSAIGAPPRLEPQAVVPSGGAAAPAANEKSLGLACCSALVAAGTLSSTRRGRGCPRVHANREGYRTSSFRTARPARGGEEDHSFSEIQMWTGLTPGKEYRLQTMVLDAVAEGTSTIRSLDWDRDRFDIEFALERGTTYNSYVVKGADKTALIDTSHEKFADLYLDALEKQVDLRTLDYLVVSHTEPDHSGLIAQVLERAAALGNESLTVLGSKICLQFLGSLVFSSFKSQVVANGDKIDLGGGHELEFVIAPNLHWPDTIFTFDHGTGLLYTCDAFGMHYCSENIYDVEGVQELLPHYALYYDCLMRPNARSVVTALKKVAGLEIKQIATGHGPMLAESTTAWVEKYRSWSEKALEKQGPSVALFWVSSFGSSERLAQAFAHGLTSSGVGVEMHDLNAVDSFEITECLARSNILAIFTPPLESTAAGAVSNIMAGVSPKHHRFVVLDSCGEGQQPVALLVNKLAELGVEEAVRPMNVEDKVTIQTVQGFEETGLSLGKALTQKGKAAAAKKTDKDLSKALGRLGSTLYVVTAAKLGFRHAMVASWLTPASESPLGISLAIAKDRAMEPLLRIGDAFTVNILEEGNPATLSLMKHFLQRFPPGADRLEGVDSVVGGNGAPVLRGACAYLECKTISRMDAGDHWVSYAEVVGGTVAKASAVAAVHHRKVGTYY